MQLSNPPQCEAMHNMSVCLTIMMLSTTVGTFHGLNCFGHVIYIPQTIMYQNIDKLLIHPNIYIYIYIKLYTKAAAKEAVLLPVKSSSDDDPGFRHGFRPKHHYHSPRAPQQYLTILPDFIGWCLISTNAISVQMQLQPCFGSFYIFPLLCWWKSDFG